MRPMRAGDRTTRVDVDRSHRRSVRLSRRGRNGHAAAVAAVAITEPVAGWYLPHQSRMSADMPAVAHQTSAA